MDHRKIEGSLVGFRSARWSTIRSTFYGLRAMRSQKSKSSGKLVSGKGGAFGFEFMGSAGSRAGPAAGEPPVKFKSEGLELSATTGFESAPIRNFMDGKNKK